MVFEVRIDENDPGMVYVVEEGANLDTEWAISFDMFEMKTSRETRTQELAQFCANVLNMDLRKKRGLNGFKKITKS